ncbi:hypothetical protein MRB53_002652 [Persea americana]|uniref:Uncharacterized protein n=1 Tax=Persea americana TaxID=3435 RepID=A0ACC2MVD2_PERAE|nr:hypothetical protein MRB53_002652 [Persea americana]
MSVVGLVAVSYCGLAEVRGKHLQYSKFWNVQSKGKGKEGIKLSSRAGMLLLYTPAFVAGAASLAFYPSPSLRFWLLSWALTIHFLKRVLEVLFVHKYSGGMILDSAILISLSYFTATVNALYAQYLTEGTPEPQIDLKYAGIVVFLVGIAGNFYHHYLLSKLREKNDKGVCILLHYRHHWLLDGEELCYKEMVPHQILEFPCRTAQRNDYALKRCKNIFISDSEVSEIQGFQNKMRTLKVAHQ